MKERSIFLKWAHTGLLLAAFLLIVTSMVPGVEWASFDRERGVGPASYELKASLEASGFEYSLTATSSGGGGIIGGLGGMNRTIGPVRKTYTEVRGDVLENLGIIYDSYKVKSYIYELVMEAPPAGSGVNWPGPGSPSAYLNVTLSSDLVPYWLSAGTRKLTVTVELLGTDLYDLVGPDERANLSVTLHKVSIKALTKYDASTGDLSGNPKTLKESDRTLVLRERGERTVQDFEVSYPDGADVAGVFVDIEASLSDHWGRPERSPLTGGANTINIRVVPMSDAMAIIGIPLAMPILLISLVIGAASLVINLRRERPFLVLIIIGLILSFLAVAWFWMGVNSAVDLLSQRLDGAQDGLGFSYGIFLALTGSVLYLLSLGAMIIWRSRSNDRTDGALEGPVMFKKVG